MHEAMSDYQKLKALNAREWRTLASAFILLPLLRIGLKACSFQFVFSVLEKTAPLTAANAVSQSTCALTTLEIASVVRMVNVAANKGPVEAKCLPRSLTIWWLLRRQGVDCELRLGVRPHETAIQAHAWVEYRGQVLNDDPETPHEFYAFERVSMDKGKQAA